MFQNDIKQELSCEEFSHIRNESELFTKCITDGQKKPLSPLALLENDIKMEVSCEDIKTEDECIEALKTLTEDLESENHGIELERSIDTESNGKQDAMMSNDQVDSSCNQPDFHQCLWCPFLYSQSNDHLEHMKRLHTEHYRAMLLKEETANRISEQNKLSVKAILSGVNKSTPQTNHGSISGVISCLNQSVDETNTSMSPLTNNKTFLLAGGQTHSNQTEIQKGPYKCENCGKTFWSFSLLEIHLFNHTLENPFKCDVCWKEFDHSQSLERHKLLHTAEKIYLCDVCGKEFNTNQNLQRCKRMHTRQVCGEKFSQAVQKNKQMSPKCTVCSKELNQNFKKNFQRHEGLDAEELLYKCVVCDDDFYKLLKRRFLRKGKGRPCDIPKVAETTNRHLLQLYDTLKEEGNASFRQLKEWLHILVPDTENVTENQIRSKVQQILKFCLHASREETTTFLGQVYSFHSLCECLSRLGLQSPHLLGILPFDSSSAPCDLISNEVVVELDKFRSKKGKACSFVYLWLKRLNVKGEDLADKHMKRNVDKCILQYRKLAKSKHSSDKDMEKFKTFLSEQFSIKIFAKPVKSYPECINCTALAKQMKEKDDEIKLLRDELCMLRQSVGSNGECK